MKERPESIWRSFDEEVVSATVYHMLITVTTCLYENTLLSRVSPFLCKVSFFMYIASCHKLSVSSIWISTSQTPDVNWTYIRRSEDFQYVFRTSYIRSVYLLCLRCSLAKWLSVRLRTKELLVRIQLQSLNFQILRLFQAKSSLISRQLQRFNLKRACDMIKADSYILVY